MRDIHSTGRVLGDQDGSLLLDLDRSVIEMKVLRHAMDDQALIRRHWRIVDPRGTATTAVHTNRA